jgi:hypothetical protein
MAVFSRPPNDDARQEAHHFGVEPYDDVVENQLNTTDFAKIWSAREKVYLDPLRYRTFVFWLPRRFGH